MALVLEVALIYYGDSFGSLSLGRFHYCLYTCENKSAIGSQLVYIRFLITFLQENY